MIKEIENKIIEGMKTIKIKYPDLSEIARHCDIMIGSEYMGAIENLIDKGMIHRIFTGKSNEPYYYKLKD